MKLTEYIRKLTQAAKGEIPTPESLERGISTDVGKTVRLGGAFLLLGFAIFILWALFAPLDEGVPAQGSVTIDTKRKTIQHLTGGLIDKVFVREGQQVTVGDLLIKLNDAQARAEFEAVRQRYLSLRANEDRLIAEQSNSSQIDFHPDVRAGMSDPLVLQHTRTQEQLIASRRNALKSELASINESILAQREAAKGFAAQLQARIQQLEYANEERNGLRELVKEGYAPRNKLLELERLSAELGAATSDLQANLAKTQRTVSELTLRKLQREQEFRKDIDSQLADIRREVSADEERYKAARDALQRTEIRAPVSGSVVGIATQTIGGVVAPGVRIMDIVPKDESLMLEAQIPPHLIDRVHTGQSADIRFVNFLSTPQLVVEGRLVSISADSLIDPTTNAPYFLARVAVTPGGLKTLGSNTLQPGMPAEIMIKTGERTLMAYLLHPLARRFSRALTEQ